MSDGVKQKMYMPRDKWQQTVPVMRVDFANIVTVTLSGSSSAEVQLHPGSLGDMVYRFWAIGADAYVFLGATGMGAATTANGAYIPAGTSIDMKVDAAMQYVRAIGSGAGTLRCERLV